MTVDIPAEADATPRKSYPKLTTLEFALLMVVVLIGAAMRIWMLSGMPEINGDECWLSSEAYAAGHGLAFTWQEPNNHLADPLFMVPLLALHLVCSPNILLARGISMVGGLLTLPFNYFFCRRAFGTRTALFSTMLLAAFPAAIAYSRLGWETVQSIPACLAVIYCVVLMNTEPDRRGFWLAGTAFSSAIAFMVYPVSATIAPLVAALMIHAGWYGIRRLSASMGGLSMLMAAAFAAAIVAFVAFNVVRRIWPLVAEPLSQPLQSLWMVSGTGQFMSGLTVTRYFTGNYHLPVPTEHGFVQPPGALDIAFTLILIACGIRLTIVRGAAAFGLTDRLLVVGVVLSILFIFAMAGLDPAGVAYNRMYVPVSVAVLLMMTRAIASVPKSKWALTLCVGLSAYYFAWTAFAYFGPIVRACDRTRVTANSLDPSRQNLRFVDAESAGQEVDIVSNAYFGYEPLHYLTLNRPRTHCYYAQDFAKLDSSVAMSAQNTGRLYWVTVGPDARIAMERQLSRLGQIPLRYHESTPQDFEGHDGNTVFHILGQ